MWRVPNDASLRIEASIRRELMSSRMRFTSRVVSSPSGAGACLPPPVARSGASATTAAAVSSPAHANASIAARRRFMNAPPSGEPPPAIALGDPYPLTLAITPSALPSRLTAMAFDLVIDIENTPGALAKVAAAISDAGVNIAAATCIGPGERAELHILVPHAEAAKHSLAISHLAVNREREVVVIDVEDRPGVLADLTRRIAAAGVDLDLVYVATRNRVVFGAPDLNALKAALGA